ncbi:MAG: hypothetical protein FJ087_08665 [Deltaproteobacteria bacterium]|nr:hypothetical protein [Deltaproteobacteria bacterium]
MIRAAALLALLLVPGLATCEAPESIADGGETAHPAALVFSPGPVEAAEAAADGRTAETGEVAGGDARGFEAAGAEARLTGSGRPAPVIERGRPLAPRPRRLADGTVAQPRVYLSCLLVTWDPQAAPGP